MPKKEATTTMVHKMLLHADMKVLKEYKKLLSGSKTKDTLVAYYTNFLSETDTNQLNRNISLHQLWTEGQNQP